MTKFEKIEEMRMGIIAEALHSSLHWENPQKIQDDINRAFRVFEIREQKGGKKIKLKSLIHLIYCLHMAGISKMSGPAEAIENLISIAEGYISAGKSGEPDKKELAFVEQKSEEITESKFQRELREANIELTRIRKEKNLKKLKTMSVGTGK